MNRDKVTVDKIVGLLDYVARNGTTGFNFGTVGEFGKVFNQICPEGSDKEVVNVRVTPGLTNVAGREEYELSKLNLRYKNLVNHRSQSGLVNGCTINFSSIFGDREVFGLHLSSLDKGIRFCFAFDELSGLYLSKPKNPGMPLGKREEILYVVKR